MPQIRRILCPSDFSQASNHAIEHAVVIARWFNASLTAIHAYNPILIPVTGPTLPGYDAVVAADNAETQELRRQLGETLRDAVAAEVDVNIVIDTGPAVAVILDAARGLHADLIVMGTHGLSGFEYPLLGSVTEKVVRKAGCPVLTVPPRSHTTAALPYKRILCATDFSESAQAAAEFAFSMAREGDAELTLMHVLDWPEVDRLLQNATFEIPDYRAAREAAARRTLEHLVPVDAREWCKPSLQIAHGKPYREILAAAKKECADLLVIGSQGQNVVDRLLFGSTTNQLVRHATCPVLTVRR